MKLILKDYADTLLQSVTEAFKSIKKNKCGLTIVTVGDDPASLVYVKNKIKKCESISSVKCDWIKLNADIHQEDLHVILDSLSFNPNVHGILLQQPLPNTIDSKMALTHIAPEKDVDGLTQTNKRFLYTGDDANSIMPCTALGILMYMEHYFDGDITGKTVLVIGRSDLVGRPLAHAIENCDATLLWTNSHTSSQTLIQLTHQADIIISAVGKPNFIMPAHVNTLKKQLFIDVGINHDAAGKLVGDCALDEIAEQDICDVTAVPGGVGQLTTTVLLHNLLKCYEWNTEQ